MQRSCALRLLATPVFVAVASLTLSPPIRPCDVGQNPYMLDHVSSNDPFWLINVCTSLLVKLYYPTLDLATPLYYVREGSSETYYQYFAVSSGSFGNMTASLALNAPRLPEDEGVELQFSTLISDRQAIAHRRACSLVFHPS
jgi:hypothetical protein